ncbi:hypothetical protein THAOC_02149, partial [Thalassiosira oceanica]
GRPGDARAVPPRARGGRPGEGDGDATDDETDDEGAAAADRGTGSRSGARGAPVRGARRPAPRGGRPDALRRAQEGRARDHAAPPAVPLGPGRPAPERRPALRHDGIGRPPHAGAHELRLLLHPQGRPGPRRRVPRLRRRDPLGPVGPVPVHPPSHVREEGGRQGHHGVVLPPPGRDEGVRRGARRPAGRAGSPPGPGRPRPPREGLGPGPGPVVRALPVPPGVPRRLHGRRRLRGSVVERGCRGPEAPRRGGPAGVREGRRRGGTVLVRPADGEGGGGQEGPRAHRELEQVLQGTVRDAQGRRRDTPGTAADEADGASGDGVGAAAGGTGAGAGGEEDKAEVEDDDDEEESAPAKRKRGAGDDEPGADDGRADGPDEEAPEPAEKRHRTGKPAEEIPGEPEEGMDFGDGGGDGGRPEEDEEDEEKDEPPKEPEVESSDEDEPGKIPRLSPPYFYTARTRPELPSLPLLFRQKGVPAERRELEVTDDGWMVAAPPRHRRAYRREIEQTESVASEVAADTERVGTLVVREYVPPGARARRAARSGRDFKRCESLFRSSSRAGTLVRVAREPKGTGRLSDPSSSRLPHRKRPSLSLYDVSRAVRKNVIIPGYTTSGDQKDSYRDCSDGVVQIVLEDSFAKDSERLRQLQMQQEELEREQAAAESLFNDDGRGGAKTGRKKKRGAGITAYMTQSTVKRGRGRRG